MKNIFTITVHPKLLRPYLWHLFDTEYSTRLLQKDSHNGIEFSEEPPDLYFYMPFLGEC